MTQEQHAHPADRTVILGGGGPAGLAWMIGYLHAIADTLNLRSARIIGTSAGAVAGALLLDGPGGLGLAYDASPPARRPSRPHRRTGQRSSRTRASGLFGKHATSETGCDCSSRRPSPCAARTPASASPRSGTGSPPRPGPQATSTSWPCARARSTICIDTDYLIDQVFWQHSHLLSDRFDARELAGELYLESVQLLHLGGQLDQIAPWLDELACLTTTYRYAKRFNRIQAL